jgi:hypothetical protein
MTRTVGKAEDSGYLVTVDTWLLWPCVGVDEKVSVLQSIDKLLTWSAWHKVMKYPTSTKAALLLVALLRKPLRAKLPQLNSPTLSFEQPNLIFPFFLIVV